MNSEFEKIQDFDYRKTSDINGKKIKGFAFIIANKFPQRSVRTRSKKGWPKEVYLETLKKHTDDEGREVPGKDNLHFISYNSRRKEYLLETAVRIGKGFERQEAKMTVDELKAEMADGPDSMIDVIRVLSGKLEYNDKGWAKHPVVELEETRAPLAPDDPLKAGRGAELLSEAQRAVLRQMLKQDPVEREDLPEGVLTTLT